MLYPFLFEPIYKSTIWGGNRLSRYKQLAQPMFGVGESWEVSQVEGNVSVLTNGPLKGQSLTQLIETYPLEVLGRRVLERFDGQFPLLFKFIDAKRDLSVQVHPSDEMARKYHGPKAYGKAEMWYVIEAEPYAALVAGFTRNLSTVEYLFRMVRDKIEEVLRRFKVQPGDVFFIPPGLVHSIGGGILLLEIQQSSDLTYRMYDYNRTDSSGKRRELHTRLAAEALDYRYHSHARVAYEDRPDGEATIADCHYFKSQFLHLSAGSRVCRDKSAAESFVVYNIVQGILHILTPAAENNEKSIALHQGQSVLVPACLTSDIQIVADTEARLVETCL